MSSGPRRSQTTSLDWGSGREWTGRIQSWDPVGIVLVVHALVLILLGDVAYPGWALVLAAALAVWRLSLAIGRRRSPSGMSAEWSLWLEGGSLVIAAGMVAADGGTESPFFFWPLILLASQALQLPARHLKLMVALAVTTYLPVALVSMPVTVAIVGRLLLLLAFSGVIMVGKLQLEWHRRQAERSERVLHNAFSAAPVGLLVVSVSPQRSIYMNEAAGRLGLDAAFEEFEEGKPLRSLVVSAWEEQRTMGPELFVYRRQGADVRYLRVIATSHGMVGDEAVVVCAEDVTIQVNAGEERRSFMRFAGHQLRTPLTPIIAYAEMLKRGDLETGEFPSAASEIASAARELERLFERMLAVADLKDGTSRQLTFNRVGDVVSRIDPEILEGVLASGDPDTLVWCDPELVANALRELIDNGHKFGEGPVRLEWQREGNTVEICVSDDGPGPDPKISEDSLFAHWGDLEAADMMTPDMGSRLGLAHARILAGLSGGELGLSRQAGDWAFVVRLPSSPLGRSTPRLSPLHQELAQKR